MNWLQKLRLRFRALFQKPKLDAQMDDEIRSHIEMRSHGIARVHAEAPAQAG